MAKSRLRRTFRIETVLTARPDRVPALEIGVMIGEATSISFAIRKSQPKLLQALNEYVVATRKTPTWSPLVVKYFGDDALDVLKRSRDERPGICPP